MRSARQSASSISHTRPATGMMSYRFLRTILTQLGRNSGVFEVTATEDTSEFSTENLKRYAAVMFYTTGELPMSDAAKDSSSQLCALGPRVPRCSFGDGHILHLAGLS